MVDIAVNKYLKYKDQKVIKKAGGISVYDTTVKLALTLRTHNSQ